jgi:hypothetical protein
MGQSASASAEVPKYDTNMNVSVENARDDAADVIVTLPDDATGNITVTVDGNRTITVPAKGGKNVINVPGLAMGEHTFDVAYTGDDKYTEDAASEKFNKTTKVIDTILVVDAKFTRVANDYRAGERGAMFYGVLMDTDGNLLANKTVQIAVNGPIYNVTTDEYGRAGLQVNLQNANIYTYALFFQGDEVYKATHIASSKLTVTKKPTSISAEDATFKANAKSKTLSVTLKTTKNPYDGKTYLSKNKKLTLKVDGKTYTARTNAKGVAKFDLKKLTKAGKFTAKISFAGDRTYETSSKNINVVVK